MPDACAARCRSSFAFAAHGAAVPAELCDQAGLAAYLDVVDSAAATLGTQRGGRGQRLSWEAGREEGDFGAGRHSDAAFLVAGHREFGVGEGEDEAVVGAGGGVVRV